MARQRIPAAVVPMVRFRSDGTPWASGYLTDRIVRRDPLPDVGASPFWWVSTSVASNTFGSVSLWRLKPENAQLDSFELITLSIYNPTGPWAWGEVWGLTSRQPENTPRHVAIAASEQFAPKWDYTHATQQPERVDSAALYPFFEWWCIAEDGTILRQEASRLGRTMDRPRGTETYSAAFAPWTTLPTGARSLLAAVYGLTADEEAPSQSVEVDASEPWYARVLDATTSTFVIGLGNTARALEREVAPLWRAARDGLASTFEVLPVIVIVIVIVIAFFASRGGR